MQTILIAALVALAAATDSYTLELDWAVAGSTAEGPVGYVTWNQETLLTLNHSLLVPGHRDRAALSFNEGPNILGLYFIATAGSLLVDNVQITKDGKSINFVLNGDFELCPLNGQKRVFSDKIPGWTAPKIQISRAGGSNQLVLSAQRRSLSQTISFGKVSKYEFIDSMNAAIQNQAKSIIAANLQSLAAPTGILWSTPLNPSLSNPLANNPQLQKLLSTLAHAP